MNDLGYTKFQRPRAKDSAKEGDVRTAFKTTGSFQAKTRHRLLHDLETTINALMTSLAYHLAIIFASLYGMNLHIETEWHLVDSTWRTEKFPDF